MKPRHTDFLTIGFDAVCIAVQVTPKCCSLDQSLFLLGKTENKLTLTFSKSNCKSSSNDFTSFIVFPVELEVGAPFATSARVSAMQDKSCILYIVAGVEVTVSSD